MKSCIFAEFRTVRTVRLRRQLSGCLPPFPPSFTTPFLPFPSFSNLFLHIHPFFLFLTFFRFPFFSPFSLFARSSHFSIFSFFNPFFNSFPPFFWSRRRDFLASFVLDEGPPVECFLCSLFLRFFSRKTRAHLHMASEGR